MFHEMNDVYEEKRTINKLMEASWFGGNSFPA